MGSSMLLVIGPLLRLVPYGLGHGIGFGVGHGVNHGVSQLQSNIKESG